jgi:hypothetical protein
MTPNADTRIPANQGAVIAIVRGTFLQTFASFAKRLLPRITTSLEEAEQKLKALRAASP